MSIESIISEIIAREGPPTDDPLDKGGRTAYGISEKSNPEAWADGHVTEAEARDIYYRKYVISPGFDKVKDPGLRAQLVDFGVTSGPQLAIMKLQQIVGAEIDGVLGPQTHAAISKMHAEDISNHLTIARVRMIGRIVSKNPSQLKFLNGWLDRALQFIS